MELNLCVYNGVLWHTIVFWNTSESQNSEIVLGCLAMGEKRKSKSKQDKQQTNINHIVFVSL